MAPGLTFIGHATVLIDVGTTQVVTDPLLRRQVSFLQRVTPPVRPQDVLAADVILISHLHHDHCDIASLKRLPKAKLVVPEGAGAFLSQKLGREVIELAVGRTVEIGDVVVTAVYADHDGSRTLGPTAVAVGYVVTGPKGTVYFAGDTDLYPEMANLPNPESRTIDVALLPVWGWGPNLGPGHMNPERAAHALELVEAEGAVPIHWGTYFPMALGRVLPTAGPRLSQPPIEFREMATKWSPYTRVEVLAPGERWHGEHGSSERWHGEHGPSEHG